jgi:quinol-cytochrome oxidoreductase complex cytochrome b subunit
MGALLVVPLLDRFRANSSRRRWIVLAIVAAALAVIVGLGIYAAISTPAEHL